MFVSPFIQRPIFYCLHYFCVYFTMFSPKRPKEQIIFQSPTNCKKHIKKGKGREIWKHNKLLRTFIYNNNVPQNRNDLHFLQVYQHFLFIKGTHNYQRRAISALSAKHTILAQWWRKPSAYWCKHPKTYMAMGRNASMMC